MAIGLPKLQIHQVLSKPLPLQHPSPPQPCIVLALASCSLLTQTGNHRNYTNALSCTCYTPPEKGSAPGRSPYNPGAGQDARGMPGGPSVVTESYRRARRLPPTLVPKTGGPPGRFLFTDAPVIYSVSCVCVRYKKQCFTGFWGP